MSCYGVLKLSNQRSPIWFPKFRAGHSTIDQHLIKYNDITESLDAGQIIDIALFDYSKAFDKVNHQVLLEKLFCIGVHPSLVGWIGQFLQLRSMCVRISDKSIRTVQSAVVFPNGRCWYNILFLVYVNHVVSDLRCRLKLLADDLELYVSFNVSAVGLGVRELKPILTV